MKAFFVFFSLILFFLSKAQKSFTLLSPDKFIKVEATLNESGELYYSIYHKNNLIIEPSKLGVQREDADFAKNMTWQSIEPQQKINNYYSLLHGKKKNCFYEANEKVLKLRDTYSNTIHIIFRASNDGIAFRYFFPEEKKGVFKIKQEYTEFNFINTATAFLQPNMESKTGWNKTQPSYEEQYKIDIPITTSSPNKSGWVLPALFKYDKY
jgi:hypothetical protein